MLLLTAPAQHIAENPAVECDPKRVKQWLASLPGNDVQSTVSQLVAALKPFNELQLDARSRLKLLELYHAAFETTLSTFDELHLRALPLDYAQRRRLSEDIMWVYLELANGYKSLVKAVYEGGDDKPSQEEILLAIYRGIELIANALIYAYRDHQTPPPLVYLEIHQLYYLAEQYQLESKTITSLRQQVRNPTIVHLYKKIMLLIAGGAYAYDGSQLNELYELLEQYTGDTLLRRELNTEEKASSFFLDFTEDQIPRSCLKITSENLLPTQRILVINQAVQHIIADLNKGKHTPLDSIRGTELRLLRSFINNLQQGCMIREQRQPRGDLARIAYGIDSVCYYLEHRDRFLETSVEVMDGIEVRDMDIFETEHELLQWQVLNSTPKGRLLVAQEADNTHLRVGEIVSIVEELTAQSEPLIHTGFIRWLRFEEGRILMGFEIIVGSPIAVRCKPLFADADEASEFGALYFPSNKATKKSSSLLFAFDQFRQAEKFKVDVARQSYRIQPIKIVNESPVHIQFGFRIIN